jgi:hypothetical protein
MMNGRVAAARAIEAVANVAVRVGDPMMVRRRRTTTAKSAIAATDQPR